MMTLRHHNFFYLLAGLLFVLLAIPVFRDLTGTVNHYVSELAFSVFFLIGIWSLYGTRRVFLLGIALVTLGVGGNILALAGMGIFLSICPYAAIPSFCCYLSTLPSDRWCARELSMLTELLALFVFICCLV